MVFWKTYPFSTVWKTIWNTQQFRDLQLDKDSIPSPTSKDAILLSRRDRVMMSRLRLFLQQNFGDPPHTPVLDIPESALLPPGDLLFYVEDQNDIVGCIRYHFLGSLLTNSNRPPMYLVDCFCIHPTWRKKGVGDYLLTVLHRYANHQGIPHCLFLKEGWSLSILHPPLYSSRYVYKRVDEASPSPSCILSLTSQRVRCLLRVFQELNPDAFIVFPEHRANNQYWKVYRKGKTWILACIQSAYQWFMEDDKLQRIGWVTCWLESPGTEQTHRAEASEQIADSMKGIMEYVWMNEEWTGSSNKWTMDGQFHWYAYQWTTSIHLKNGYCIIH
jgi:hypothetical protein